MVVPNMDLSIPVDFAQELEKIEQGAISPYMTVSQFAERYRKIKPPGHKTYQLFDFDNTPYLRMPCDLFSAFDPTRSLTVVKGARLGFTQGFILNSQFYNIKINPCPQLYISATDKLLQKFTKVVFRPTMEASGFDELIRSSANTKGNKNKSSGDTIDLLEYGIGDYLMFIGAKNPDNARQLGFQIVYMDERATYSIVPTEGDWRDLAEGRQMDYGLYAKTASVSTPTLTGCSFHDDFESGTQHEWRVKCPLCGGSQYLEFAKMSDPDEHGKKELLYGLYFEHEAYVLRSEPKYKCRHCKELFPQTALYTMNLGGEWVSEKPDSLQKSLRISGIYSNFNTWDEIARKFLTAKKKGTPEALQGFMNLVLGEFWEHRKRTIEITRTLGSKDLENGYHRAQLPDDVAFLTATFDVQGDRIEGEVKGWGKNKQNYSIEYIKFDGDTDEADVWNKLETYILEDCTYGGLRPEIFAIDSGDGNKTDDIEDFCRAVNLTYSQEYVGVSGAEIILPLKGQSPTQIYSKQWRETPLANGLTGFRVNTYYYKKIVLSWINREQQEGQPKPMGFCHFPNDYPTEYYNQLKSEKCIETQDKNGYAVTKWIKLRDRNEALDLFVYNAALCDYVTSEIFGAIFKEETGRDWTYGEIVNYLLEHRQISK